MKIQVIVSNFVMPTDINLKAARAVILSRQHFQSRSRDASSQAKKPLSLREAEDRYAGSSRASIARIVKRLEAANSVDYNDVVEPKMGRPRILTNEEEEAIITYIMWMDRSGLPASKWEIEDAALTLLRRRDPEAKPMHKMWYTRFRDDHPELAKSILKSREGSRAEYEEAGVEDTKEWFERLEEAIRMKRIGASETWNADEAGVRVGMLRDKMECLVVRTKKKAPTEVYSPQDRETCTVIGSGNAAGDTTPPWLIFKSLPTLEWAYIDADPDIHFAQSDSAFSNAGVTLEWAKHFNRRSWEKSAVVKNRQLDFEEWFGCNEHLQDKYDRAYTHDVPPASFHKESEEQVWRLLIIDGFSGHGAFEFREYMIKFNILVAFLPPHSTHILQPMDVGVFQFLKDAHQKKLREALRKGDLTFGRRAFAGAFQVCALQLSLLSNSCLFSPKSGDLQSRLHKSSHHERLRKMRHLSSHAPTCNRISAPQAARKEEDLHACSCIASSVRNTFSKRFRHRREYRREISRDPQFSYAAGIEAYPQHRSRSCIARRCY